MVCVAEGQPFSSEITYRRIFCQNYNYSFFQPRKEQCLICENKNNEEFLDHIRRRDESSNAKSADNERAISDKSFVCATFDLQSVLQIPYSDISPMYYSRKLCTYNLTIFESAPPKKAYCYAWTELNGQRGSAEIGTALLKWVQTLPPYVKEISVFSDTCSGQNRNQYIAALFLFIVQNSALEVITHNFLEKGHSYMEVDSMHSAIESANKYVSLYTMQDWLNIFKIARSKRGKNKTSGNYIVTELKYLDFMDLKSLSQQILKNRKFDKNGQQIKWLNIKQMRYKKCEPGHIEFKYDYTEKQFRVIHTNGQSRSNPKMPTTLGQLYHQQLCISDEKKRDLIKLCDTKAIPDEFHLWYKSLPTTKKRNTAPEPSTFYESDEN